jgi:hypothetical protein
VDLVRFLEEHGILPNDRQLLKRERLAIDSSAFFAGTSVLLPVLAPLIEEEVIKALPALRGHWHPTGFMVFPLGAHPDYGTLRLHIWPAGIRHRIIQGRGDLGAIHDGDIHNHAWNIASLVLTIYHDHIYEVARLMCPGEAVVLDDPEVFRKFSVSYHPGNYQTLVTDGSHVRARTTRRRALCGGTLHTIAAGDYHAPVVPTSAIGATLVFSSPRVMNAGPDVLIGGVGGAVEGVRRSVVRDEAQEARDQLTSCGVG